MQIQRVQNNNNYNPNFKHFSIPRNNEMQRVLMESSPQCIEEILQAKKVLGCRGETGATKNFHVVLGYLKLFGNTKIKGELRSTDDAYFGPFDLKMNNYHYIAEHGYVPLVLAEPKFPWILREQVELIPDPKKIVINTDDPMFNRKVWVRRYYNKDLTDSGSYVYSIDEDGLDYKDLRFDLPKLTRITKILDMAATKNAKDSIPEVAVNNAQNTQEQIKKDESIATLFEQCGFDCYE